MRLSILAKSKLIKHELKIIKQVYKSRFLKQNSSEISRFPKFIVGLTSYPARFSKLHFVLESLLKQTAQPEKIILYLSEEEIKNAKLSNQILRLKGDRLDIQVLAQNFRSYNKLIHALKSYPDHSIITVDDDRLYEPELFSRLIQQSSIHQQTVICGLSRRIMVNEDGSLRPYGEWPYARNDLSFDTIALGYSGVLYPPRCLHEDVLCDDVFTALAPTTDDIWFKIMSVLQSTPVMSLGSTKKDHMAVYKMPSSSLWKHNRNGINDASMANLIQHYGISPLDFKRPVSMNNPAVDDYRSDRFGIYRDENAGDEVDQIAPKPAPELIAEDEIEGVRRASSV